MMEGVDPANPAPRAFLRVGGATIARHQLGLVLALGCERIVCLARSLDPHLVAMQHIAEKAGTQFQIISQVQALGGLVTAADELIVLNEGLLAMPDGALELLGQGTCVLMLPVEQGLPAGFERIDLNHAAAGAMRLSGSLAEGLSALPPDCDAASALLRIALQSGVAQRMVPPPARAPARWSLVRTEAEAQLIEAPWIGMHTAVPGKLTTGNWIARQFVRSFGPALLHAGTSANALPGAALALILLGIGSGWFGITWLGLLFAGIAWTLRKSAALLLLVERDSLRTDQPRWQNADLFGWSFDGVLVGLVGWGMALHPWQTLLERGFAPVILVSLLRLLPRVFGMGWTVWLEDRLVLCLLLGLASLAGFLGLFVQVLAMALAIAGIALPRNRRHEIRQG